jgi:hypothetical protein
MEKERWQESEKRKAADTSSEKRKSQKKEDAGARKCRKVAKHSVFPMFCAPGLKSRLAKAAEPSGEMRDEQLHAEVAPSRFGSQNVKNILGSARSRTLLEVQMLKKCTPLWREAHFDVKSVKN